MQQTVLARIYVVYFPILQCPRHKILIGLFQIPILQRVVCQIPFFIFPLAWQKVLFDVIYDPVRWKNVGRIGCYESGGA